MRFRNGDAYARDGRRFGLRGTQIEFVSQFSWSDSDSQAEFCEPMSARAAAATASIGNLRDVDTKQAMAPFLTTRDLIEINKIKSSFVKRVLGLPKNCSSTLALHMISEITFVEDLILGRYDFTEIAVLQYREHRERKNLEFTAENFTDGLAFISDKWKRSSPKNRRMVCRITCSGYHN